MVNIRFCYRVEKGLAHDTETGEDAPAFVEAGIQLERPLTDEEYAQQHTGATKRIIADSFDIDPCYVTPITPEEHDASLEEPDEHPN